MKKWKILLPNLLAITSTPLISLSGCVKEEAVEYKIVEFNTNGGSFISAMRVPVGEVINKPATDPTKLGGYEFDGWFDDEECSEWAEHDFSQPVVGDITIYAKWIDPAKPTPTSITLNKNSTEIERGKSETLFADVLPSDASQDVTWESENQDVATVDPVNGTVTAVGNAHETARISATTVNGLKGFCTVTVTQIRPSPEGITVTPSELTLKEADESVTLFSEITPTGASQDVTWTTSDASKVTVNSNGVITPVFRGEATITATSVADPTKSATCEVTVEPAIPEPEEIELNPKELSLKVGGPATMLFSKISPAEASQDVEWESSRDDIVTVVTGPHGAGVVTAVSEGDAEITATSVINGITATCEVHVSGETPTQPWTVTFYNGEDVYKTELIKDGEPASRPKDPENDPFHFKGWYIDNLFSSPFDWTTPIYNDTNLYAGWTDKHVYSVSLLNPAEDGLTINENVAVHHEDITLHIHSSKDNMESISVWNLVINGEAIYDYEFLTADKNNALLIIPGNQVIGNIQAGFEIEEAR